MFRRIYQSFYRHYHRRYHGVYAHAKQLFVFDLGLLTLAIALLGTSLFFFLWKPTIADQIELNISLGEERILSGQKTYLTFSYTNHSKELLHNVILGINLPAGFVLDASTTPANFNPSDSTFTLPDLKPGAKGQVELEGTLWTEPLSHDNIITTLTYTPEKSNEPEQKLASYLLQLPKSVVNGHLDIATSTFANLPTPFTYTVVNNGDTAATEVSLEGNYPLTTTDTLNHITIAPHGTLQIHGTTTLPAAATQPFTMAVKVSIHNHEFTQESTSVPVAIVAPHVMSSVRLPSSTPYITPGLKIPVEVTWKNNGQVELQNMKLILSFTPHTVDLKATAKENNLRIEGDTLVADSSNRTALANGKPGASDTFTFVTTLLPTFSASQLSTTRWEVQSAIEAGALGIQAGRYTESGTGASVPLATELSLRAEARYYTDEGDQLGRGPLPPTVGQTTKYWIIAEIDNTTNPIKDAAFSATLAPGAQFTGQQSVTIGPALKYNSSDRTISWNYSELPANSQTGLYFEVAITPSEGQVGTTLPLTQGITFSATDENVGKVFNLSKGIITNQLPKRDQGSSAGTAVVVQ